MEENQELMFKLSMFEQQIQQLQQQLQAVEQGIVELSSLDNSLNDLIGSHGKEILTPVGRGIFAKAKLISEDLIVDIGEKNFVSKDIPGTKKILQEQIQKLKDVKIELSKNLEKVNLDLSKTMETEDKSSKDQK